MRKDLTDVTVVLDRSGSMSSCQQEAQNGVNHFVKEQQSVDGECLFSLIQFDTEYEFVHRGVPIKDVPEFTLVPRGMTALLDAVGRAINEAGERLAAMAEDQRPGLVIFVIVTDGHENSSHEFTKEQIKEMIERQQRDYQWKFTFLGANQDAFASAASYGVVQDAAANYAASKTDQAFKGSSAATKRARQALAAGQNVSFNYTNDERTAMSE